MNKICLSIFLCIVAILTFSVDPAFAQGNTVVNQVAQISVAPTMSSQDFESWLLKQSDQIEVDRQKGTPKPEIFKRLENLENSVLSRLEAEKFTTDTTILKMQSSLFNYESLTTSDQQSFSNTERFTTSVISFLNGRILLESKLRKFLSQLYFNENKFAESLEEKDKVLSLLTPLHIDVDVERISTIVESANILYEMGEEKRAEALFLEALSYDWFKVQTSPSAFQRLKELYLQAGRGLIEVRRNDLNSLQEIVFWPSTMKELGPILNQAIEEAQKNGK